MFISVVTATENEDLYGLKRMSEKIVNESEDPLGYRRGGAQQRMQVLMKCGAGGTIIRSVLLLLLCHLGLVMAKARFGAKFFTPFFHPLS